MKSLDVDSKGPYRFCKIRIRRNGKENIRYRVFGKKIKAQGEPKKAGGYHPTHALLLEEYAKDYRKIFLGVLQIIFIIQLNK